MDWLTNIFATSTFASLILLSKRVLALLTMPNVAHAMTTAAATQQTTTMIIFIGLTDLRGKATGDGTGDGCSWVDIVLNEGLVFDDFMVGFHGFRVLFKRLVSVVFIAEIFYDDGVLPVVGFTVLELFVVDFVEILKCQPDPFCALVLSLLCSFYKNNQQISD